MIHNRMVFADDATLQALRANPHPVPAILPVAGLPHKL